MPAPSARPVVRYFPNQQDSRPTGEHRTFHEALAAVRNPPGGAMLIQGGAVLAVGLSARWELRDEGIATLQEEFWSRP